ncbi:hypothetical protein [Labedaea rhizosphaerae]|uniref:Uncharacterized protein n=1 Tax=Labedaea rhizosphaerae TaxID=598644 RepID=A0A4R6RS34_LABRH|nr:hypothetical protein [Labedaea rhizosphaerae]TDP89602.1 hypothetical protein EV186_1122 [Labedaea rhizosphaerae]
MRREDAGSRTVIGLADEAGAAIEPAAWAEPLVQLGKVACGRLRDLGGRQLVIAISVPCRDYAAALVASGWALAAPAPTAEAPIDVFRRVTAGTPLRVVTERFVAAGPFGWLDEERPDPRVFVAGKTVPVERYKVATVLRDPIEAVASDLPQPGFLGREPAVASTWLARIAEPAADLALVGTASWLREDLAAYVGSPRPATATAVPLANYVLPEGRQAATWSTRIYSASKLADELPIPRYYRGVILDGYGAIKYLDNIEAPVVVCVIDRSVADESAAEVVMQARSANSRPISLREEYGWRPPAGVEALAFTVAL